MEKELRDQVVIYGVWHGRRRSYEEKTKFLNGLAMDFGELGMPVSLLEDKPSRTRDLIAGDIEKAGVCVISHYDTPQNLMSRFFHLFPFDRRQTALYARRAQSARLYFAAIAGFLPIAGGIVCYLRALPVWSVVLCGLLAAVGLAYLALAIRGGGNRCNFNENDMAAVVALRAAAAMDEATRSRMAFVFLDNHYNGFKGEKLLIGQYRTPLAGKHGVVLEAVACGQKLFVAGSVPQREKMASLSCCPDKTEIYERPVENIGPALASCVKLSAGRRVGENVVTDGTRTPADMDYDPELMQCISQMLAAYSKKIICD